MTCRLQEGEGAVHPAPAGRVVRTADIFGRAEPRSLPAQVRTVAIRQRAVLEALTRARGLRPPTRGNRLRFVAIEGMFPLAATWVVISSLVGALVGWMSLRDLLLVMVFMAFGKAATSAAALLVRASMPHAPGGRRLAWLLIVAPLEFVCADLVAAPARAVAVCRFVLTGLSKRRVAV
jgi:hypothetical protein